MIDPTTPSPALALAERVEAVRALLAEYDRLGILIRTTTDTATADANYRASADLSRATVPTARLVLDLAAALAEARGEAERVRGALGVLADHVQGMRMLVSALDIDVESENMTSYQALCDRINDADGVLAALEVGA